MLYHDRKTDLSGRADVAPPGAVLGHDAFRSICSKGLNSIGSKSLERKSARRRSVGRYYPNKGNRFKSIFEACFAKKPDNFSGTGSSAFFLVLYHAVGFSDSLGSLGLPSLFRFVFTIAALVGLVYLGMLALATFVTPEPHEIVQSVPPARLNR